MALPETIPVRRTEEEAEFVSVRPVVRQTFRIEELVDMLLAVAGKDAARVQQILRSGTVVYHYYRYWWESFAAPEEELRTLLATFPDAEPSRPFRAEACTAVLLERAHAQRPGEQTLQQVERAAASRKMLFRRRSLWDALMEEARKEAPAYQAYSYARRADVYALALARDAAIRVAEEVKRLAPRGLRFRLGGAAPLSSLVFVCPRGREKR